MAEEVSKSDSDYNMIDRTIREGQWWSDGNHAFEVVEKGVHDIRVRYEDDHEAILDAARDGLSKAGCARTAGTQKQNLQRYLEAEENADFRDAFARARARGERRLLAGPLVDREGEPDMDGQHARFILSTSFDYVKTEKRELENTGDEPLSEVTIDFTDVDT